MRAVDGVWWSSKERLPEKSLVRRRYFDVDTEVEPWLIPDRFASPELRAQLAGSCGEKPEPYVVVVPRSIGDVPIDDLVTFEVVPEARVAKNDIFQRKGGVVTQLDFPDLSMDARKLNQADFGQRAHLPD